jgi:hypothetical protein
MVTTRRSWSRCNDASPAVPYNDRVLRRAAIDLAIGWMCCCASACGRIGIDSLVHDAAGDVPLDVAIDVPPAHIAYVAPFVARSSGSGATETFSGQAHAAGNAIVVQVSCAGNAIPDAATLTATGWSFQLLGGVTASTASPQRSATFVAIAPDALGTTFTLSWSGSTCQGGKNDVGDEFAMVDPAGGAITFDSFNATEGIGNCVGTVRLGHDEGAVWAACNSNDSVNAVGRGFTKGADDNVGDWAEYAITHDPAGTVEPVEFDNDNVGYVLSMVTLKPQ